MAAPLSNPSEGYYEAVGKRGAKVPGAFASRDAAYAALERAGYATLWPISGKLVLFGTSHVRMVYTDTQ